MVKVIVASARAWRDVFCPDICPGAVGPFMSRFDFARFCGVFLVGVAGFEPATPSSRTRCSSGFFLKVQLFWMTFETVYRALFPVFSSDSCPIAWATSIPPPPRLGENPGGDGP